ncbi:hypothetical protein DIPPA_08923 [Diplonema papillatum]|nr:hypothetical protein DIPPA_08923 [Diplonema papillatum]
MSAPPSGGPGQRNTSNEAVRPTQTGTEAPWQWVPAKRSRQAAELRGEDWDVPVVNVQELRDGDAAGVAIASRSEAKKAIGDGKKHAARAVVVLGAVQELAGHAGQTCPIVVRRGTRIETTTGTVFQMGEKEVGSKLTWKRVAMPGGDQVQSSSHIGSRQTSTHFGGLQRLSICVPRQHTTASEWGEATTNLRAYLGQFASELGVSKGDVLITGVETRGRAEDPARSLGALMRVPQEQAKKLEAASGHRGVFVVPKLDAGTVVWLTAGTTLAEAKDLANSLPTQVQRLAVNRRGLGLRVTAGAEEEVRSAVGERSAPRVSGKTWDVFGFSKQTMAAQVEEFLGKAGWEGVTTIKVIPKRGKALAVVRGPDPPAWVFGITDSDLRIDVSTARPIAEAEQRWVQAPAQEKRQDPAETGTAREREKYTWAEFLSCYGRKQGRALWRESAKQPHTEEGSPKGSEGGKGGKRDGTGKGGKGGKGSSGGCPIQWATGTEQPAAPEQTGGATEMAQLRAQLKEAMRQIEELTRQLAEVQAKQLGTRKSPSPRRGPSTDNEEDKKKKKNTKEAKQEDQRTGTKKRARSGTESASRERSETKPPAKIHSSAAATTKKPDRQSTLVGFMSTAAK